MRLNGWISRVLLALFCWCAALSAQAKMVAIVFDTSPSMNPRYQLPSFGASLLAATIDGRAGFDRLLVLNFDDYQQQFGDALPSDWPQILDSFGNELSGSIKSFDITNGQAHQIMLRDLAAEFEPLPNRGSTPYGPIEVMLDRIARDVERNGPEEIVLIVVTDGEYMPPDLFLGRSYVPVMRPRMQQFYNRIKATNSDIRAEFLFIDANRDLAQTVEDQGVRDTLLEVFNEGQRAPDGTFSGSRYVTDGESLWDALTSIISSVADTDREAQDQYITYSGTSVEIESPLSISRVVVVSTAPVNALLPKRQSDTFGVPPSDQRTLSLQMPAADAEFRGFRRRQGRVEHLWFQDPVPATIDEPYRLEFSAPVTGADTDLFLLFETNSKIGLQVFDADDNEVLPGQDDVRTLYANAEYTFRSRIEDVDDQGNLLVVDLADLPPSLTMQLSLTGAGAPGLQTMDIRRTENEGVLAWRPTELGEAAAWAQASAGILSPESDRIELIVVSPVPDIEISPLRSDTDCVACTEGEVRSVIENETGEALVGEFDVTSDGTLDGSFNFSQSRFEGFEIRDEANNVIDPNADIPFGQKEQRTYQLWRKDGIDPDVLADGGKDIEIIVSPTGIWRGDPVRRAGKVLIDVPELRLLFVRSSNPITPGTADALVIPGAELLLGNLAAQFSLVDVIRSPSQDTIREQATLESNRVLDDSLLRYELIVPDPSSVGFNAFEVRPNSRFICLCGLFATNTVFGTDRREISVSYTTSIDGQPVQQASTRVPLVLPTSLSLGGLSCLLNIFLLFLTYMFLRGVGALLTTHRFPKGSRIELVEPNERVHFRRLDKGNSVWWKAWFAVFTGNPDEKRVVDGLRLRATSNGAILDISKNVPNWNLERLGGTFEELKEMQPKKTEYKIQWDDRFESVTPPGRALFLRKGRRK